MIKDRDNVSLSLGDRVAFGTKQQYDFYGENLRTGRVTGTDSANDEVQIETELSNGLTRKSICWRKSKNVIKLD